MFPPFNFKLCRGKFVLPLDRTGGGGAGRRAARWNLWLRGKRLPRSNLVGGVPVGPRGFGARGFLAELSSSWVSNSNLVAQEPVGCPVEVVAQGRAGSRTELMDQGPAGFLKDLVAQGLVDSRQEIAADKQVGCQKELVA